MKIKDYYTQGGIEVIDIIKAFSENLKGIEAFSFGNAVKYLLRYQFKDETKAIDDLEKCKSYIDEIILNLKNKNS